MALFETHSVDVVPTFSDVAARKLQELQERGYTVTGYAIEKPVEGGQPERGFINAGGFVGWWRAEHHVDMKLPLPYPQGEPGMGGVLLHGTVLVPVEGQDQPQPRAVARMACPMCHGDSGYHRAVPVDGTLPTGNPNVPMTAQYVACARCDGADGVSLDGAHWHREPVLPIGYEAQPANGQRIAGLSDQRQNDPQIIPETISEPLADHIAERGNMVALDGDLERERALFEEAMYRRVAHLIPNRAVYERSHMHKKENGDYINTADMVAWDLWQVGCAMGLLLPAPIPVSERAPENGQSVLFKVSGPSDGLHYGMWLGGFCIYREGVPTFSLLGYQFSASHWLPMPQQCVNGGG